MLWKRNGKRNRKKEEHFNGDEYLVETIQPQGGISFRDERYILTGSGYETCIHIYELPNELNDYWLSKVCNLNNVITTIDFSTEDVIEVKRNLNKSMQEQEQRYNIAQKPGDKVDAERRYQEMDKLYREIESMGEVVKLMHIRLFVYGRTFAEMEEQVKAITTKLEVDSYRCTVLLNETKNEWISMFQDYATQMENPMQLYGLPLASMGIAGGNPFHFSSLEDPNGDYLGSTPCGGNVLFDEFYKSPTRLYYNMLITGEMGSGKSTTLKKRFKARAIRGDYVRAFDISDEFTDLTLALGGKVIKADGSDGILNPLEILAAGDNDNINFVRHISKVTTIFRFLMPQASTEQITDFQNLLQELYESFGLTPAAGRQITGRPAKEYPIFSDLLAYIDDKMGRLSQGIYNELEMQVVTKQLLDIDSIRKTIQKIVNTYGSILNGHTSVDNILDEQILTFDLSKLKDMEPSIFDAQIFNIISLCWDNCVTNGSVMKRLWEKGEIAWEDIVRFLIIIDESHRWLNANKLQALELITLYMREARKYFGGIALASQSIRDYVPEGTDSQAVDRLKTIFELTQYKFIFRQQSTVIPILERAVYELTATQKNKIPKLQQGEGILLINSDVSLELKVYLTEEEKQLFAGGA